MSLIHHASSYLRLCRAWNCAALGSLFGAASHYYGNSMTSSTLAIALSWAASAATGYSYNDIRDVSADRINRPDRPLPAGEITLEHARCFSAASAVVAVLFATLGASVWPVIGLIGSLAYSAIIRYRSALAANLITAALVTLIPASAAQRMAWRPIYLILPLVFALIFARELQKDLLDAPGDEGHRPVALLLRFRSASVAYVSTLVIAVASTVGIIATSETVFARVSALLLLSPIILLATLRLTSAATPDIEARLLKVSAYLLIPFLLMGAP